MGIVAGLTEESFAGDGLLDNSVRVQIVLSGDDFHAVVEDNVIGGTVQNFLQLVDGNFFAVQKDAEVFRHVSERVFGVVEYVNFAALRRTFERNFPDNLNGHVRRRTFERLRVAAKQHSRHVTCHHNRAPVKNFSDYKRILRACQNCVGRQEIFFARQKCFGGRFD